MPTHRFGQFQQDIARARDLVALGQSIAGVTAGRVDNADMYRFALVQGVAALDAYVHGVVLDRAVDLFAGRITTSPAASKVGLPFSAVQEVVTAASSADMELAARSHIVQRLSAETFQRPDAIGAALAMVGVRSVWKTAFPGNAQSKMTELGLIVDRRNNIVHSCDNDPLTMGALTSLSDSDALDAITTIEEVVSKIDPLC